MRVLVARRLGGCSALGLVAMVWLAAACSPAIDDDSPQAAVALDLFTDIASASGLGFEHFVGATGEFYFPETAAAGVALLDYDGDGDLDVFLPQGELLDTSKRLSAAQFPPPTAHWPGDRLFRNDVTSEGPRFVDVTAQAGLATGGYGMGVAVGDYDNDVDLDLYVTRFGSNSLYRNEGDGTFVEVTARAAVDDSRWSASSLFVDIEGDGDLDLFVVNYVDFTVAGARPCTGPAGQRDYCGPLTYQPLPDRLFRNEGDGHFVDVTAEAGLHSAFGSGLGAAVADFDGDGRSDIYVANDLRPNQLWRNRGDGVFEDIALFSGTAYNLDGRAEASMGLAVDDLDGDGREDLLLTHLGGETNTFYRNLGGGAFVDATHAVGLATPSRPMTGFGTSWIDYDHDGLLDLLVANGAVKTIEALRGVVAFPFQQKNQLLHNRGDGTFEDVSEQAGAALQLSEVSRGLAVGDVDNDGDLDAVISNANGPVRLLRNNHRGAGSWLSFLVESRPGGESALATRIAVSGSADGRTAWRRVHTDGSYLSAHDQRAHWGLGDSSMVEAEIYWPGGGRFRFLDLPTNTVLVWRGLP